MGWQDAPVVSGGKSGKAPAWMAAPVVGAPVNPASGPISEVPNWEFGQPPAAAPQPPAPGIVQQAIGAGEAALAVGTGAVAAPIGAAAGLAQGLTSPGYGTSVAGTNRKRQDMGEVMGETSRRFTYEPRTEAGKEALHSVGKALDASKLAGLGPTEAIALGGARAPGAVQAARGGAESVGAAAGKVAGAAKGAVTPAPEVLALAQKAEAYGIPLRPDMLTDNRIFRMVGEALEQVPASGSKGEARKVAFNKAIMQQIGANTNEKKLTPAVFNQAMLDSGEKIGAISAKHPIPLDGQVTGRLTEIVQNAQKYETADVAKVVGSYVGDIGELGAKNNGTIDGVAFRKLRTKIGKQMRAQQEGDLKHALSELDDVMLDMIQSQLTPAELAQFGQARYQYANAKTLVPLVGKSATGDMSPAALMGAMTNTGAKKEAMARGRGGEMGDLARIGQKFIKEPDSSGTAERGLAYKLMGGGAAAGVSATNPAIAAGVATGVYGAANLYNRAGAAISRRLIKTKKDFDALKPGEEFVDGRTGKVTIKGGGNERAAAD